VSTAIAERPAVFPAEELDLIKKTVANGATDAELKLFLFDCQRRGVHPLDKLIHFTKRGGRYTPVTSIDFMRSQAAMTGEMAGSDDAAFVDALDGGHPESAFVTVYRLTQGQRFAYSATARWSEYCPDNAPMWRRMPHTMLGKCAEALALRKAFPQQLAGLYTTDEMDQANNTGALASGTEASGRRAATEKNGAEQIGEVVPAPPPNVNAETGEELPPAPAGYHYVANYSMRNGWHEADLLKWDDKGGALHISTKLKIGELLSQAANFSVPAKCDVTMKKQTKGEAYVNKVTLWKAPADPGITETIDADSIPF
jgi:phage recombination protein Bet